MKKAIILTMNKYPQGDAGSIRNEVIRKMLVELRFDVDIVCMGTSTKSGFIEIDENSRFLSCRGENSSFASKLFNVARFFKYSRNLLRNNAYSLIIYDTLMPLTTLTIIRQSRLRKIPVVHNSVEWYSPSVFTFGFFSPNYMLNRFTISIASNYATGVLSISQYLNQYFLSQNRLVLNIPFIVDCSDYQTSGVNRNSQDKKLTFAYAGSPGRKDDIKSFVEAIASLNQDEKAQIEVFIVGVTKERLRKLQGISKDMLNAVDGVVYFLGRVPKEQAENYVSSAHFTFLFRDANMRFAKAGFPTKVVESCAMGIPVLCNLSSDLGEYLVDSENSIISESRKVEDIARSIRRCLTISESEWCRLSQSALELARTKFTYQYYLENLRYFLQEATKAIDTE